MLQPLAMGHAAKFPRPLQRFAHLISMVGRTAMPMAMFAKRVTGTVWFVNGTDCRDRKQHVMKPRSRSSWA